MQQSKQVSNSATGHPVSRATRKEAFYAGVLRHLETIPRDRILKILELSGCAPTIPAVVASQRNVHYHIKTPEYYHYNPNMDYTQTFTYSNCKCSLEVESAVCDICSLNGLLKGYSNYLYTCLDVAYDIEPETWIRLLSRNKAFCDENGLNHNEVFEYHVCLQVAYHGMSYETIDAKQTVIKSETASTVAVLADNDFVNWRQDYRNIQWMFEGGYRFGNVTMCAEKVASKGDFVTFRIRLRNDPGPLYTSEQNVDGVIIRQKNHERFFIIPVFEVEMHKASFEYTGLRKKYLAVTVGSSVMSAVAARCNFSMDQATTYNRSRMWLDNLPPNVSAIIMTIAHIESLQGLLAFTDNIYMGKIRKDWLTMDQIPAEILRRSVNGLLGTDHVYFLTGFFDFLKSLGSKMIKIGEFIGIILICFIAIVEPTGVGRFLVAGTLMKNALELAQETFGIEIGDTLKNVKSMSTSQILPLGALPKVLTCRDLGIVNYAFSEQVSSNVYETLPHTICISDSLNVCYGCGEQGFATIRCPQCSMSHHLTCRVKHVCVKTVVKYKILTKKCNDISVPLDRIVIDTMKRRSITELNRALKDGCIISVSGSLIPIAGNGKDCREVWYFTRSGVYSARILGYQGNGASYTINELQVEPSNMISVGLCLGKCPDHSLHESLTSKLSFNDPDCEECGSVISKVRRAISCLDPPKVYDMDIADALLTPNAKMSFVRSFAGNNIPVFLPKRTPTKMICDHEDFIYFRYRVVAGNVDNRSDSSYTVFRSLFTGSDDVLSVIDVQQSNFGLVRTKNRWNVKKIHSNWRSFYLQIDTLKNTNCYLEPIMCVTECALNAYGLNIDNSYHTEGVDRSHWMDLLASDRPKYCAIPPDSFVNGEDVVKKAGTFRVNGRYDSSVKKFVKGVNLHGLDMTHFIFLAANPTPKLPSISISTPCSVNGAIGVFGSFPSWAHLVLGDAKTRELAERFQVGGAPISMMVGNNLISSNVPITPPKEVEVTKHEKNGKRAPESEKVDHTSNEELATSTSKHSSKRQDNGPVDSDESGEESNCSSDSEGSDNDDIDDSDGAQEIKLDVNSFTWKGTVRNGECMFDCFAQYLKVDRASLKAQCVAFHRKYPKMWGWDEGWGTDQQAVFLAELYHMSLAMIDTEGRLRITHSNAFSKEYLLIRNVGSLMNGHFEWSVTNLKHDFLFTVRDPILKTYRETLSDNNTKMTIYVGSNTINFVAGDITKATGVIVNAANENLAHGGGVALAISKAAGLKLKQFDEGRKCKRGSILESNPGNIITAETLLHTVAPVGEDDDLVNVMNSCLREIFKFAMANKLHVSLPPIGTGIFRVPKKLFYTCLNKVVSEFNFLTVNVIDLPDLLEKDLDLISDTISAGLPAVEGAPLNGSVEEGPKDCSDASTEENDQGNEIGEHSDHVDQSDNVETSNTTNDGQGSDNDDKSEPGTDETDGSGDEDEETEESEDQPQLAPKEAVPATNAIEEGVKQNVTCTSSPPSNPEQQIVTSFQQALPVIAPSMQIMPDNDENKPAAPNIHLSNTPLKVNLKMLPKIIPHEEEEPALVVPRLTVIVDGKVTQTSLKPSLKQLEGGSWTAVKPFLKGKRPNLRFGMFFEESIVCYQVNYAGDDFEHEANDEIPVRLNFMSGRPSAFTVQDGYSQIDYNLKNGHSTTVHVRGCFRILTEGKVTQWYQNKRSVDILEKLGADYSVVQKEPLVPILSEFYACEVKIGDEVTLEDIMDRLVTRGNHVVLKSDGDSLFNTIYTMGKYNGFGLATPRGLSNAVSNDQFVVAIIGNKLHWATVSKIEQDNVELWQRKLLHHFPPLKEYKAMTLNLGKLTQVELLDYMASDLTTFISRLQPRVLEDSFKGYSATFGDVRVNRREYVGRVDSLTFSWMDADGRKWELDFGTPKDWVALKHVDAAVQEKNCRTFILTRPNLIQNLVALRLRLLTIDGNAFDFKEGSFSYVDSYNAWQKVGSGDLHFSATKAFASWRLTTFMMVSHVLTRFTNESYKVMCVFGSAGAGKSRIISGGKMKEEVVRCPYGMVSCGSEAAKADGGQTYETGLIAPKGFIALDEVFLAPLEYVFVVNLNNVRQGVNLTPIFGDPNQFIGGGNYCGKKTWFKLEGVRETANNNPILTDTWRFGGSEGQALVDTIYGSASVWASMGLGKVKAVGPTILSILPIPKLSDDIPVDLVMADDDHVVQASGYRQAMTTRKAQGLTVDVSMYLGTRLNTDGFSTVGLTRSRSRLYVTPEMYAIIFKTGVAVSDCAGNDVVLFAGDESKESTGLENMVCIDLAKETYDYSAGTKYGAVLATVVSEYERRGVILGKSTIGFMELCAAQNLVDGENSGKIASKLGFKVLNHVNGFQSSTKGKTCSICIMCGENKRGCKHDYKPYPIEDVSIRDDVLLHFQNGYKESVKPAFQMMLKSGKGHKHNVFDKIEAKDLKEVKIDNMLFMIDCTTSPSKSNQVYMKLTEKKVSELLQQLPDDSWVILKSNSTLGFGKQICFPVNGYVRKPETFWLVKLGDCKPSIASPQPLSGTVYAAKTPIVAWNEDLAQHEYLESWLVVEPSVSTTITLKTKFYTDLPNNKELRQYLFQNRRQSKETDGYRNSPDGKYRLLYTYHEHSKSTESDKLKLSDSDAKLYLSNIHYALGCHVIADARKCTVARSYHYTKGRWEYTQLSFTTHMELRPIPVASRYQTKVTPNHCPGRSTKCIYTHCGRGLNRVDDVLKGSRPMKGINLDCELEINENAKPLWAHPFGKDIPDLQFSADMNSDENKWVAFFLRLKKDPIFVSPYISAMYVGIMRLIYDLGKMLGWFSQVHLNERTTKEEWITRKDPVRQKVLRKAVDTLPRKALNQTKNFGKVEKTLPHISTVCRMIASMNPENLVLTGPAVDGFQRMTLEHAMTSGTPVIQTDGFTGEQIAEVLTQHAMDLGGDGESYDGGQSFSLSELHSEISIEWMSSDLEKEAMTFWPYKWMVDMVVKYFVGKMLSGSTITLKVNSTITALLQLLGVFMICKTIVEFIRVVNLYFRCVSNGDDAGNNGLKLKRNGLTFVKSWENFSACTGVRYVPEECHGASFNYNSSVPMMDKNGSMYMQRQDIHRDLKSLYVKMVRKNPNQKDVILEENGMVLLKRDAAVQLHSERYTGDSMPIKRAFLEFGLKNLDVKHDKKFRKKLKKVANSAYTMKNSEQHEVCKDSLEEYMATRYGVSVSDLETLESKIRVGDFEALRQDPLWLEIISKNQPKDKDNLQYPGLGLNGEIRFEDVVHY